MSEKFAMEDRNKKTSSSSENLKEEIKEILQELDNASVEKLHSYTQQKNFTKGLVDIALLTANANQLRHVIEFDNDTMRTLNITFISLSIILQVSLCTVSSPLKPRDSIFQNEFLTPDYHIKNT